MISVVVPSMMAIAALLMLLERRGAPLMLHLSFKGDIKRESQFLAQYGQAVCTIVAALVILRLDTRPATIQPAFLLAGAVAATSIASMLLKRLLGRVRPRREQAGRFLGPSWRHANHRESFPSSHSACAVAMTVILARLYPPAAPVFWALAIITATLRYVLDAHWPSDVIGGMALGYLIADQAWRMWS